MSDELADALIPGECLAGPDDDRTGILLDNQLVQADAAETLLCATLAATTLLGLVLFAALGWWWADPIAALAVAYFAVAKDATPGMAS